MTTDSGPGLVLAARRMAEALVCGFASAAAEGRPLTEVQQADMIAAGLLAFDGLAVELAAHELVDRRLGEAAATPAPWTPLRHAVADLQLTREMRAGGKADDAAVAECERRVRVEQDRTPGYLMLRCDMDSDSPMSAAGERTLDALGDERGYR